MARSYKRGWIKYAPDSKGKEVRWAKSQAARQIRRLPIHHDIPNGKAYRKYYNPYDIHDIIHRVDGPYNYAHNETVSPCSDGYWLRCQAKENRMWACRYFKRHGKIWKRS